MARIPSKVTVKDLISKANRSSISSLGGIVSKITEITRNINASANDLQQVVEVDPPLCAKLLRRTNSAVYALKKEVNSIQHAIVMLGFSEVKELALSLKVGSVFDKGIKLANYDRKELWKFSLATAMTAKRLMQMEFKQNGDEIYTIALLHDIGSIVLDEFATEQYTRVLEFGATNPNEQWKIEKKMFGFDHTKLASDLIESWQLPSDFSFAVKFHHRPYAADLNESNLPLILFVVDYICHNTGPQILLPNKNAEQLERALTDLNLDEMAVEIIAEEVWEEIYKMEAEGELF